MIQNITGQFQEGTASGQVGCILQDWLPAGISVGWTAGAATSAQIAQAIAIPPLSRATVLAWSIGAYLGYTGTGLGFGKFGRMVAGLSQAPVPIIRGGAGQPWSVALPGVPDDSSLTETIWDPAADIMPPTISATSPPPSSGLLPLQASQVLATPMPLDPGALPYVAVWMWPSLLGTSGGGASDIGLAALYGKWSITYDDGLPG